jgi:hypothetical protein
LLWLTLVVAAFLAGMACDRAIIKRQGYMRVEFDGEFERLAPPDFVPPGSPSR